VEATRSIRQAEIGSVRTMIDRVNNRFGLTPERLIADTAYGTGAMLDWLDWLDQQRGIAPHIPVVDKSARRDGTFERADFTYDAESDVYTCPGGKGLKQGRRTFTTPREKKPDEDGMLRYRASKTDCDACALRARCCPREPARKVTRSIFEPSRDRARAIAQTTDYAISCKLRKKVEMLFAHLKHSGPQPAPIARTKRRARRIPPRSHRTKPPEARKAASEPANRLLRNDNPAPGISWTEVNTAADPSFSTELAQSGR
jgi:hypothetical protein